VRVIAGAIVVVVSCAPRDYGKGTGNANWWSASAGRGTREAKTLISRAWPLRSVSGTLPA